MAGVDLTRVKDLRRDFPALTGSNKERVLDLARALVRGEGAFPPVRERGAGHRRCGAAEAGARG